MSEEPHDRIAINDRGVIGCRSDDGSAGAADWVRAAEAQGYWIERVPVEEAVRVCWADRPHTPPRRSSGLTGGETK